MDFDVDDLYSLEKYLILNNISKEDVCLVGSTTLSLIGIREHNDIDIVVHSNHHDKQLTKHQIIEQVNIPWSTLFLDDNLIENSDLHILYDGFKFVIPELIYHKKIWHNRVKDQSDIIELKEYAKMHDNWDWKLIEDALPKSSFFKVILKKNTNRFHLYNERLRNYFRYDASLHEDAFQMIPTAHLLAKQIVNNSFNRYDLIVRFMAIDSFLNAKKESFDLYEKMQEKRGGSAYKNPWKVFQSLISNFKNNGANPAYPILVNKDLHIVDGAHRLACALYFNVPFIAVKINKKLDFSPYGIDWFENNNFSYEEIEVIQQKKNKIFQNNNLYFEVVLWPSVLQYFNEIETLIKEKYIIQSSTDYKDISNFTSYIKALYKIDDIKDWKVDLKIKGMSSYPKDIRVLKIEILEPEFRKKENGQLISRKVEDLKKEIRSKYKSKVDNYFHDIIIHIGDNYSHTKKSNKLI
tara:strand:+ start:1381 stop:2775 length:1395 start_codon:yes stop_codon:yes gene_type:complete